MLVNVCSDNKIGVMIVVFLVSLCGYVFFMVEYLFGGEFSNFSLGISFYFINYFEKKLIFLVYIYRE